MISVSVLKKHNLYAVSPLVDPALTQSNEYNHYQSQDKLRAVIKKASEEFRDCGSLVMFLVLGHEVGNGKSYGHQGVEEE